MRDKASVPQGCGYYVTDGGHEAALDEDLCRCQPHLIGRALQCPMCLTIYGLVGQGGWWTGSRGDKRA